MSADNAKTVDVAVLGGGISGLATAWRLRQKGLGVLVVDKFRRLGGVVYSRRVEGPGGEYLVEQGPNSFASRPSHARDLCVELGLEDQLIERVARDSKRYLFDGKQLREVPMGPFGLAATPLLSWPAKVRAALEPLKGGLVAEDDPEKDVSLGGWVESHFGAEVLANFVTPLVSGIYAADPKKISLRSTFPALFGFAEGRRRVLVPKLKGSSASGGNAPKPEPRRLVALRDGNETLIRTLRERLEAGGAEFWMEAELASWERDEAASETVLRMADGREVRARHWVVATPAETAYKTLRANLPEVGECLASIDYAPMVVAHVAVSKDAPGRDLDGFGFLVPRERGVRLLGCIWNSAMFPGRAPEGHHLLTCFLGGQLDPEAYELDDETLDATLREDLGRCFGLGGPLGCEIVNVRRWRRALPIFHVGYPALMERLRGALPPWLTLASNYLESISVPECVKNAGLAAERAAANLDASAPAPSETAKAL